MQSAEIWYELGKACSEMGLLERAAESFEKAIEQKMQSGLLCNQLAEIYVLQGNFTGALLLYQKSLELFTAPKELSQVWGRIGNAYTRLNEYGKAIQAFQKSDEILPKQIVEKSAAEETVAMHSPEVQIDEAAYLAQGEMDSQGLEQQEHLVEVEAAGEEGVQAPVLEEGEAVQESASAWNELGLVLFKVGAYEDAIDAYQKAILINPAIGYLYSNLGQVYSIQGKLGEALQQYEKSLHLLESNRDKSVSWARLGDLYRQLGQFEHAEPAYLFAEVLTHSAPVYNNEYRQVKLETISTNSDVVRGMDEVGDLVQSVRTFGIIQPLLVCPGRNEPGKFTLISGRRRLEAARLAGLKEVPVIVRQATNQEILELSISENIHHLAVTPFELAQAYVKMANEFELSIEEISAHLGRSCHSVANIMKMLEPSGLPSQPTGLSPKPVSTPVLEPPGLPTGLPALSRAELQENGQKIIDRSLAALQAQNSEVSEILPGQALSFLFESSHFTGSNDQIEVSGIGKESAEEPVPALWYLETSAEENLAQKQEKIRPDAVSLLTRARRVLKSNPQANRLGADSSHRG